MFPTITFSDERTLPHASIPEMFPVGICTITSSTVDILYSSLCPLLMLRRTVSCQEEKRQASKQEDFEKMKELSAHMDNIVQRLSNFFPLDEDDERVSTPLPQPVPELPPLPKPEQLTEVRNTSVSARVMTMDRAVSARRLTTDRAVSVASGLHFEDEISSHSKCSIQVEAQFPARREAFPT